MRPFIFLSLFPLLSNQASIKWFVCSFLSYRFPLKPTTVSWFYMYVFSAPCYETLSKLKRIKKIWNWMMCAYWAFIVGFDTWCCFFHLLWTRGHRVLKNSISMQKTNQMKLLKLFVILKCYYVTRFVNHKGLSCSTSSCTVVAMSITVLMFLLHCIVSFFFQNGEEGTHYGLRC